jgi:P pilus assembly chaperone PapD
VKKIIFLTVIVALLMFPAYVFGRIGVGVATGKIVVNEKLKPGIIYNLPPLTVLNTGDVPSDYEVKITYFEKQAQIKPSNDWFIFSPTKFHLNPGEAQAIAIKLNLPITVKPGDYFGFLEAHPLQKNTTGKTTIGIAAATKLYFTVVPANILHGIYYKVISFWEVYAPWPQRAATIIVIIGIIIIARKFFKIQIVMKNPKTDKKNE